MKLLRGRAILPPYTMENILRTKPFYTNVKTYGNSILFRGYDENGKQIKTKIPFKPYVYVPDVNGHETTLFGVKVRKKKFDSIKDARKFIDMYRDADNAQIHGETNFVNLFMHEAYGNKIDYNSSLIRVGDFDIEVHSPLEFPRPEEAKHPVTAITYRNSTTNVYHVWTTVKYDPSKCTTLREGFRIKHYPCVTEEELLTSFLDYWSENYPDVITGWNITQFDVVYIVNRLRNLFGDSAVNRLSPWGVVRKSSATMNKMRYEIYDIYGIPQLDYIEVFKKFGYVYGSQESYALDHIANVVLGVGKLSYEEYGSLTNLYNENPQKYIDYNIRDVDLVEQIEETTNLLKIALAMAYRALVNYDDTLGSTKLWESMLYHAMSERGIVVPHTTLAEDADYEGAYVKEPVPGKYGWNFSMDINSLYPMTIVQYNMSPETLVQDSTWTFPNGVENYLNGYPIPVDCPYTVSANGSTYRKDKQGILPIVIEGLYAERKSIQRELHVLNETIEKSYSRDVEIQRNNLDNEQMVIKILLNSLYGCSGTRYFKYYNISIAEGITKSGQLANRTIEKKVNLAMNTICSSKDVDYSLYMDTDSLYLNVQPIIDVRNISDPIPFISKLADEVIQPVIDKSFDALYKQQNAFKNTMKMKRENISEYGIWMGKKMYMLYVRNSDGVTLSEPKIKITGIKTVKPSSPPVVRKKFMEAYRQVLLGTEHDVQKIVQDFYDEFTHASVHEISIPRGISDIDKWVDSQGNPKKGTPIHVRAAINHNNLIRMLKIPGVKDITNGDKIRFVYLKQPNITQSYVIAFANFLPSEFGLEDYIDYNLQYEKTFRQPLKLMLDVVGWNLDKINTIESLFE